VSSEVTTNFCERILAASELMASHSSNRQPPLMHNTQEL
jgi:hypothetical protein